MAVILRALGAAIVLGSLLAIRPALNYVDGSANHARTETFRPGHGSQEYATQKLAVAMVLVLLGATGVVLLTVG